MAKAVEPNADAPQRPADDFFGSDGLLARTEAKLLRELAVRPDKPSTLWQLATIQRRRGNVTASLETCRRIATLLPDNTRVGWTRAVLSGADLRGTPAPTGNVPTPFERLQGFLTPVECDALLRWTASNQNRFEPARIANCDFSESEVQPDIRQASVVTGDDLLDELPWFKAKVAGAGKDALTRLPVRDLESFEIELNLTAHRDGDYFRVHKDLGAPARSRRRLSFVYYFHHQPRRFSGGDLLLHDTDREGANFEMGVFTRIEPLHNSIVFFPSDCFHEITTISGAKNFADARFTLNGWFKMLKETDATPTPA